MNKICFVVAAVFLTFAAFAFHPFGSFEFGWMGIAVLALGLAL